MKKTILLWALLLILMLCLGCSKHYKYKAPVSLYYPNAEITFGHDSGVISAETRESKDLSTEEIIRLYLAGPLDPIHNSPFPKDTALITMQTENESVTITLSDAYASLSGYSLTIANSCLAKTVMELTNLDRVIICCETKSIGGEARIELTMDDIIWVDDSKGYSSKPSSTAPKTTQ